ncbi:MAG: amidohydrolase [Oscillospiraceae bacterium]|nr:amidohydrolase [Oscillospiraceae bacterium]
MNFYSRALKLKDETVYHRRYLHRNAECGLNMPVAKKYITHQLSLCGIKAVPCGFGLTATIGSGKPVILLRADMDALPMKEQSGESFSSTTACAHTCGHDFHTAMLLTAAKLLKEQEHTLKGTVKLMFQPAEETLEGARNMIEHGILRNPDVDAALAFHTGAGRIPVGTYMYNAGGTMMLSADNFCITICGKGGHGAYPELSISPINMAAHIYNAFNSIVSLEVDPQKTCMLSIGRFCGGESGNVIPESVVIEGSFRTDDADTRKLMKKRISETATGIAKAFGGSADVHWLCGAPALVCSKTFTDSMAGYISELDIPRLAPLKDIKANASEDFAHIAASVPSAMIYISAGFDDERGSHTAHSPKVLFNEDVCPVGAAAYAHCAFRWLEDSTNHS